MPEILLTMGTLFLTTDRGLNNTDVMVVVDPGDEGDQAFTFTGPVRAGKTHRFYGIGGTNDVTIIRVVGTLPSEAVIEGLRIGLCCGTMPAETETDLQGFARKPGRWVTIP